MRRPNSKPAAAAPVHIRFDFISRSRRWFLISALLMVLSLAAIYFNGINLGLEFRGGTSFEVRAEKRTTTNAISEALSETDAVAPVVQEIGVGGFLVQTERADVETQKAISAKLAEVTGTTSNDVTVHDIGPKWGKQISSKAIRALIIFLFVATLYISMRFELKMALVAMVGLVHDVLFAAGIYALSGLVVTPATVIAFLTILGYSLYDTIIVFDRLKERAAHVSVSSRQTYSEIGNQSLNQVLGRSINTTVINLLPVGSLLFIGSFLLGATTLRELAFALFFGMAAGTYSSIFLCVPLLAVWKEREPRWAQLRTRIAARDAVPGVAARVSVATAGSGGAPDRGDAPERVTATPGGPAGSSRGYKPPKRKRRRR